MSGSLQALADSGDKLTIAVTGASGTVGRGLLPLLEQDTRVRRVIAIGSRPYDPIADDFCKVDYRQVDVRDRVAVRTALEGTDAVAHLAFSLYGIRQNDRALEQINVDGSLNVLEAAIEGGARRFASCSSAAVYGFDTGRPELVDESAAVDPDPRHFYQRQKALVESSLLARLSEVPDVDWVLFRPCAIVGPHAWGASSHLAPPPVRNAVHRAATVAAGAGLRPLIPGPPVPMQFVHEADVGQAIHLALTGPARRGIYNLAGDGVVPGSEVPRLLGLHTLPLPQRVTRGVARALAAFPYFIPAIGWLQLATQPIVLDTTRAKRDLGWRPRFDSRAAIASTRPAFGL